MSRAPLLPKELLSGPFTFEEASRAGLSRWHLEGASWKRVGRGLYLPQGLQDEPMHLLRAALRRLPPDAVFSGLTAAWLHGIDVPWAPIEATVPRSAGITRRAGMLVRRAALRPIDVVRARGLPAASMLRTLIDLCKRLTVTEAVVIADAALHLRQISLDQMKDRRLYRVLDFSEPASESPMESRLRMVIVLGGLPRPRAQVSIHDQRGRVAGRPDLYYADQRLGIEYDGDVHRSALAADNRRQNRLLNAGVRLLRFTAGDVLGNPESVVAQVREMLAS